MQSDSRQSSIEIFSAIVSCCLAGFIAFSPSANAQEDGDVIISMHRNEQVVQGFGAANIVGWRPDMTEEDIENAFGTEQGQLGLSILRLRIPPDESQWNVNLPTAQKAYEMGVKVIASPWSPPAEMKTNNDLVGGRLKDDSYQDYADHLKAFANYMAENEVPLHAISVQNEPDIQVNYESCDWTPEEITRFIRENAASIGVPIIAPESFQFRRPISDAILNDSAAAANLDIVGGHIYGGGLASYPLAEEKGKEIWMTEYLMNQGATSDWGQLGDDVIWGETMEMLNTIQQSMKSNWNAYIWWYLKRYYSFIGEGEQGTTSGEVLKRGHAFSQFSKFVRPGYTRVRTDGPFGHNYNLVSVTAYKNADEIVIVALNNESSEREINFEFVEGIPAQFTQYRTSLSQSVEQHEGIEVSDNSFATTLPAQSVTTFISEYVPVSAEEEIASAPNEFKLLQNYPNPFNPVTVIRYQLPASSVVSLKVFDMLGREVATLVDGRQAAGEQQVQFDAMDLSTGIYFYSLETNNFSQTRKMLLIK